MTNMKKMSGTSSDSAADSAAIRRRAEGQLRKKRSSDVGLLSAADTQRVLHELQVHQIELEMQNTELQESRNQMELLLEKHTDLYDFAPVGYFSLDAHGLILEVNLAGATLLGVERSRLQYKTWQRFVSPASRPLFLAFLKRVLSRSGNHNCEVLLLKAGGVPFWADLHAMSAAAAPGGGKKYGGQKSCRMAVSDITALKRLDETQRRLETLSTTNRAMEKEITRREAAESALKHSKKRLCQSLAKSNEQQQQARRLARQVLLGQELERKRISRDLHDQVAQTLAVINSELAALQLKTTAHPRALGQAIARSQRRVAHSVDVVHRFACELRPAVLDDVGLIPALKAFCEDFRKQTGIHVTLKAFAGVERLNFARRTALYRITQAALSNVAKHAQAGRVTVTLAERQGFACLTIQDDGHGFAIKNGLSVKQGKRIGLLGMRERVEAIGGKLGIESTPDTGTTLCAEIPVGNAAKRRRTT